MLETRKITFGYGREPLFREFSFAVAPGERVALSAPSGFGKTTLCRLLAGYERPWSGEILVDGKRMPMRGTCPVQLIGQHPELAADPYLRIGDTLKETGPLDDSLIEGLSFRPEWFSRYPHELSGGELTRICIARALAASPRYLMADDISSSLDAVTQAQIWRFLMAECSRRNIGIVFCSHSSSLNARVATRIVDLTSGDGISFLTEASTAG